MKLWIALVLILMVNVVLAQDNMVYLLDLHYDNGKISLSEIKVEKGFSPDRKIQSGDYKLEVISFDNKALYSFNFKAPRVYSDKSDRLTGKIDGEVIDLEKADFTLIVPYLEDGKDIKIYKENNEVFSTDVSKFSIKQSLKRSFIWLYIILIMLFCFLIIFLIKRKKKKTISLNI